VILDMPEAVNSVSVDMCVCEISHDVRNEGRGGVDGCNISFSVNRNFV